tara:strand:- start:277 stop:399 length:123 start_codon:yes stop_codon:yes gene_type:complete
MGYFWLHIERGASLKVQIIDQSKVLPIVAGFVDSMGGGGI